jgi:hypothetical protein
MWTLEDALLIIRKIAPIAKRCGLCLALRGSVLLRGESNNDLDLLFVVEEPDICSVHGCLKEIATLTEIHKVGDVHPVGEKEQNATIWLHDGRHIEARFLGLPSFENTADTRLPLRC